MTETTIESPEFPAVSAAEWRERVESELGDLDFERALVATLEGVGRIEPLYSAEDVVGGAGVPGLAPYVRGSSVEGANRWVICQTYSRWSPEEARREILADLRGGAGGVLLRFDAAVRRGRLEVEHIGRDGVAIHRLDDLRNALDGVHLEMIPLRLDAGGMAAEAAALLFALVRERGLDAGSLHLSLGVDPLGTLAAEGELPKPLAAYGAEMARLVAEVERSYPSSRALAVSSATYHEAGADPALELGCLLGALVDTFRRLGAEGVAPTRVARQLELRVPIGKDLFLEIAKLRALRGLWSRVLEVCGAEPVAPTIHALPSRRALSVRDPWVNMLRVTAQCLAAAVGGAQSIGTAGFDRAAGDSSELARRVARNTQLILAEESSLAKVLDPAGGSYYVESLTRTLAESAWRVLQSFEAEGGFTEALVRGDVATRIADSWTARRTRLHRRKLPLTGVSAFPNLGEKRPIVAPPLPLEEAEAMAQGGAPELGSAAPRGAAELVAALTEGASLFELQTPGERAGITALPRLTDAGSFEALRERGEQLAQPAIFLANLGRLAEHKPRSSFATEAFGVAGLACDMGSGTDAAESSEVALQLVGQFRESPANGVCLCGTDPQYDELGADSVRALADAGAKPILVAGRPGSAEALAAAGVSQFLRAGDDLHALLDELVRTLEGSDD